MTSFIQHKAAFCKLRDCLNCTCNPFLLPFLDDLSIGSRVQRILQIRLVAQIALLSPSWKSAEARHHLQRNDSQESCVKTKFETCCFFTEFLKCLLSLINQSAIALRSILYPHTSSASVSTSSQLEKQLFGAESKHFSRLHQLIDLLSHRMSEFGHHKMLVATAVYYSKLLLLLRAI